MSRTNSTPAPAAAPVAAPERRSAAARAGAGVAAAALAVAASACAHAPTTGEAIASPPAHRTTADERGSMPGGPDWFTGSTRVAMLFGPDGPRDFSGATVTFEAGARTRWHTHPAGQTLLITDGTGWVQFDEDERLEVHPGDVVWIPAGVRHWHGATDDAAMTHIALQGAVDGRTVDWLEPVTDAEYAR